MRAEERAQQSESHISTMELICSPTLRAPLIIGIVMQLSQQFSGINAVFYYSTSLFVSSGLSEESAKFATIGIGAIMVSNGQRIAFDFNEKTLKKERMRERQSKLLRLSRMAKISNES